MRFRLPLDITGNKYGRLTVVGRSDWLPNGGKKTKGWDLICDCSNKLSLVRNAFDPANPNRTKQISCGCLQKELTIALGRKAAKDYKGLKIGRLTATEPTQDRASNKSIVWRFVCECGSAMNLTIGEAKQRQKKMRNPLSCSSSIHTDKYLHYPETPSPYPVEAGNLLQKYIKFVDSKSRVTYSEAVDERMDALIRVCWIVAYKRSQGEVFTERQEKSLIFAWMRYGRLKAFQKFLKFKYAPRKQVTIKDNRLIGDVVTNATLSTYPNENIGGNLAIKHKKFKRC